ncbi:MAG: DUF1501 domain-containing protein [Myxococcales bacterium]|nr:DUF1501 domain-containing protein [Myxococcales bacterium]
MQRAKERDLLAAPSRRQLLGWGAAAAATGLAVLPGVARGWGDPVTGHDVSASVSTGLPYAGFKVLEIFLYGGLSPWETLWWDPDADADIRSQDDQLAGFGWSSSPSCVPGPAPGETRRFLGTSATGLAGRLRWGPATQPLWDPAILDRTRLIAMHHDLEPHEAAIPLALSGQALGRPNAAGMGAPISRRYETASATPRTVPASYVFLPSRGLASDNFQVAGASGLHGGNHRPLVLKTGASLSTAVSQLSRTGLVGADPALALLADQYEARLTGLGGRVRSASWDRYRTALGTLRGAPELRDAMPASVPVAPIQTLCTNAASTGSHETAQALELAAHLLSLEMPPGTSSAGQPAAAYACVVDAGVVQAGGAGYDTHGGIPDVTTGNLFATLQALRQYLYAGSGTAPAGTIDLRTTLVIVNTEFGRTPVNRDHWPSGYANLLIGGPIRQQGIVGEIDTSGLASADALTPTDFRAACLYAAGIHPLADATYSIADLSDALTGGSTAESTVLTNLRTRVLGLT